MCKFCDAGRTGTLTSSRAANFLKASMVVGAAAADGFLATRTANAQEMANPILARKARRILTRDLGTCSPWIPTSATSQKPMYLISGRHHRRDRPPISKRGDAEDQSTRRGHDRHAGLHRHPSASVRDRAKEFSRPTHSSSMTAAPRMR